MKSFLRALAFALTVLSCALLLSEDKPWIEVRSPHFRLMTNGSERDGRHMLRQFELMRAVFESQFPGFKLDAAAPLLILAPKDEYTSRQLLPQFWAHSGPKPAGFYHHGWEREYAIVNSVPSDKNDPDAYHVIYHEYSQSLLHINFRWLPSWLDEGLAEFYGYTRFEKDKMYIGAPPKLDRKIEFLRGKNPIPIGTFIESRVFSRDEEKTHLSYVQAWALTHFLTFGPGMQNGKLLTLFFKELQHGAEQKKVFIEIFGPFDDVQKKYDQYIEGFSFPSAVFPVPASLEESDFAARSMTLAETHAELAAWHIRFHQWEQVRKLTAASLTEDPKLSLAHEDNGFLQFNEGKDDEAVKEFSAAVSLDPKNYIALFAQIMTSPAARSNDPKDRDATYHGLEGVLDWKPDFAPAYVELAKIAVAKGQMPLALGLSRKAEQLEPFRSGYHVLSGEILLRMNRPGDAAAEAAYVAQRWGGSDRDEALELLNSVPLQERSAETPAIGGIAQKWQTATGTVKSVTCDGRAFGITLDVNGQPQTFKSTGFPVGFSDTLWVGHDHFSPCFHVQGLRAMLRFNASKDHSYTGDLIYVGFRDDLGPQLGAATAQASAN
jgi:hypothetical protein